MGSMGPPPRPRWGILSCGKIASDFCTCLKYNESKVVACATENDLSRAQKFAARFGIVRAYGSYRELVDDPDVSLVYVASQNAAHYQHVKMCLEAKKHVLCEKPLTLTPHHTDELFEVAKANNVRLIEAVWSRCFPATKKAKQIVESGRLGKVKCVRAEFGFRGPVHDPSHRLFATEGVGATWDLGCYPLNWSLLFCGRDPPLAVKAVGSFVHGCDVATSALLLHAGGAQSMLRFSIDTEVSDNHVSIECEKGRLYLNSGHTPTQLRILTSEGCTEVLEFPLPEVENRQQLHFPNSQGLLYEARETEETLSASIDTHENAFFCEADSKVSVRVLTEICAQLLDQQKGVARE